MTADRTVGRVQRTEIVFGLRHRMKVTRQADAAGILDGTFDQARLGGEGADQDRNEEKESKDDAIHKRPGDHVAPRGHAAGHVTSIVTQTKD